MPISMGPFKLEKTDISIDEIKEMLEKDLGSKYKVYTGNKFRNLGTGGKSVFLKKNAYHGASVTFTKWKDDSYLTIADATPSTFLAMFTQRMGLLVAGILRIVYGSSGTLYDEVYQTLQKNLKFTEVKSGLSTLFSGR